MIDHQIVELLRNINSGADLPLLLRHHGIAIDNLPPKKRRRVLNRLAWCGANFASALARARTEIAAVAVADSDKSWAMMSEEE